MGPQGMLDPVAELPENVLRHVVGILGAEIHAHALGSDETDHLFHPLKKGRRGVAEEEMGLVEKEDQTGPVQVADLGKILEELGQEPEKKGGVEARLENQLVRGQDMDDAPSREIGPHEVGQIQGRFAEKVPSPLLLERQDGSLNGGDGPGSPPGPEECGPYDRHPFVAFQNHFT